jgi:hypothetical protein
MVMSVVHYSFFIIKRENDDIMHIMKEKNGIVIQDERFTLNIKKWDILTRKLAREACAWLEELLEKTPCANLQNKKEGIQREPLVKQKIRLPQRNNKGQFQGLFSKDQMYKSNSRIPLYKSVVDHILENTGGVFRSYQVADIIEKYWNNVIHREISEDSKKTYASAYIQLMKEKGYIQKYNKRGICKKINKDVRPYQIAEKIYETAEKSQWTITQIPIPLSIINKHLPDYTLDDIKGGLAQLVSNNLVTQYSSTKVRFNSRETAKSGDRLRIVVSDRHYRPENTRSEVMAKATA